MTGEATATRGTVKTLSKALDIINVVAAARRPLSLAQITRKTDLTKPTAHRIISVLVEAGMLRAFSEGRYVLGAHCLILGTAYLETLDIRAEAAELMQELAMATGEACHLGVLDNAMIVYIDKVESPHPVRMYSRIGGTNPAHSSALGKAIVAHAPEEVVEAVLDQGLPARTPNTITEPGRLRKELVRTRQQGYAVDDVENEEGIRCIAAPVIDYRGEVVAGLSISGPEHRITPGRIDDLGDAVRKAALALSQRLGYRGDLPIDD